jgi:hypothetical protein
MIVPIVRSQISRLVCVSIDYPTPQGHRSIPTYWGKTPVSPRRSFARRSPAGQPWQYVQKSRITHKTIDIDFKGDILCINDVRKWNGKWRI